MTDRRGKVVQVTAWLSFVAAVVAGWAFGEYGTHTEHWLAGQLTFAVLSALFALWALTTTDFKRGPIVAAVAGWAVGQWRLLELLLMVSIWSITGFAP